MKGGVHSGARSLKDLLESSLVVVCYVWEENPRAFFDQLLSTFDERWSPGILSEKKFVSFLDKLKEHCRVLEIRILQLAHFLDENALHLVGGDIGGSKSHYPKDKINQF